MRKTIILLIFISFLFCFSVYAQTTTSSSGASIDDLRNSVINENFKTRAELKAYLDKMRTEMSLEFQNEGQKFIDDNFQVLEDRIKSIFRTLLFAALVGIIASIVLANAIWFLIKRAIRRIWRRKKEIIRMKDII